MISWVCYSSLINNVKVNSPNPSAEAIIIDTGSDVGRLVNRFGIGQTIDLIVVSAPSIAELEDSGATHNPRQPLLEV